jgi:hypothetical protein
MNVIEALQRRPQRMTNHPDDYARAIDGVAAMYGRDAARIADSFYTLGYVMAKLERPTPNLEFIETKEVTHGPV